MTLVFTRENKLIVENARNLLALEGIETVMKNEFSSGAAGDLARTLAHRRAATRACSERDCSNGETSTGA